MRIHAVATFVWVALAASLVATPETGAGETGLAPGPVKPPPQLEGGPAGICQIGPGLASTLLVPYFEVDLSDPIGRTTLISVNNGLSLPTLTRLVVWTDWGLPTLAFDIYLEGFDVQTINLRSLFFGLVPATGVGADLSGFPFCDALPPTYTSPALTPGEIEQLGTVHTGQPGHIDGLCYGADHGDQVARGYITVDVVDECSGVEGFQPVFTPANTSYPYFVEGGSSAGIAIVDNRLWGDVLYLDDRNNFAQGSEAVAVWADPAEFSGSNIHTFYGYLSGYDGRDERVPLPWRWDQRFLNGGPFAGGADLIVFQQPHGSPPAIVTCGSAPVWWPLETGVATLDEEASNLVSYDTDLLPNVTQRVPINTIAPPYDFGWIQIQAGAGSGMWVQPSLSAGGRFSAGYNGHPVEFLCGLTPLVD